MSYFDHPYISNSDIKAFLKSQGKGFEDPENLQLIFDFGSYFHSSILEPHLQPSELLSKDDVALAHQMRDTFWKDPLLRYFVTSDDFHREKAYHEKEVKVGPYVVKLKCKCDGVRLRTKTFLELKGLNVGSEKEFREALVRYEYDQAAAHYMLTGDFERGIVVGISKRNPKLLWKWFVKRHDEWYNQGEQKLIDDLTIIREFSPEDVRLVA